jgi:predicted transcriptional regulator
MLAGTLVLLHVPVIHKAISYFAQHSTLTAYACDSQGHQLLCTELYSYCMCLWLIRPSVALHSTLLLLHVPVTHKAISYFAQHSTLTAYACDSQGHQLLCTALYSYCMCLWVTRPSVTLHSTLLLLHVPVIHKAISYFAQHSTLIACACESQGHQLLCTALYSYCMCLWVTRLSVTLHSTPRKGIAAQTRELWEENSGLRVLWIMALKNLTVTLLAQFGANECRYIQLAAVSVW